MNLCIFLRIVQEKIQKIDNNRVQYGVTICFFATLNKEQKSSYVQLCRRLNGKMLVLGFLHFKSTPIVQQKMRKNQHVKRLRFSQVPKKLATQNRLFTAITPYFCFLTDTKQSLQYTITAHLSGPSNAQI